MFIWSCLLSIQSAQTIDCFSKFGIPLQPDKQEGPSSCLTILGIELDSLNLQACLPQDKFDRITALLEEWSQKCLCNLKELVRRLK